MVETVQTGALLRPRPAARATRRWRRVAGIAGLAGVRGGGAPASSLPSTLVVSDPYGSQAPAQRGGGQENYGALYERPTHAGGEPQRGYAHGPAEAQAGPGFGYGSAPPLALPDTVNVMSIIDQPPVQQPSYGLGARQGYTHGASGGGPPLQPPAQPSSGAPPGWTTHYTPDQRRYYYNAATGESSWA